MSTGPAAGGYYTASGPSYATALVAGAAALVLGYRPDLTVEQLTARLEATAYRLGTTVPDPQFGHGTVDLVAAVTTLLGGEQPPPATPSTLAMPAAAPASTAPRRAVTVAVSTLGVIALVALAAAVAPRGRARGWKPASGAGTPEAAAPPTP